MTHPFFTIGHSTRTVEEFVELLRAAGARFVADVRTVPRSRTNPQYNRDTLPSALAACQIGYEHIAALGGLRGRQQGLGDSPNGYWENQSFRNYADYALTPAFRDGLDRLIALGADQPTAVMCAEAVWWRCHRRIIADYLLWRGHEVLHILAAGSIRPAAMTPAARPTAAGLVYSGAEPTASTNAKPP